MHAKKKNPYIFTNLEKWPQTHHKHLCSIVRVRFGNISLGLDFQSLWPFSAPGPHFGILCFNFKKWKKFCENL